MEKTESLDIDEGFVEFIAHFIDGNGENQTIHKRSRFCRLVQNWCYIDGIKLQLGRNR